MREWIDDHVIGLREACTRATNSDDIFDIYDFLNITIKKLNKDNVLLKNNQALYIRDFIGREIVFIRDDLDYMYMKFILAHELGHAILHTNLPNAAFNQHLINKGKYEKQATYFALKLLEVDCLIKEYSTIGDAAKLLHIPVECLQIL